ncbi:tetratricopeptide repeat protein [Dokdonella soli]|uniref:Tetratricopeptide repeat protein n=1 Tax=Dokdonella soli TaxID=529810 RepID=A0ABP3TZD1_9GAMM
MPIRSFSPLVFTAALALAAPHLHAEALIRPVPTPDTSKLAPARAEELNKTRNEFERVKQKLVGDPLAEAYALMGAAYARMGFYDAASVALEDAAQLSPKDGRWVYAQGILARMQKQNAVAQNYFDIAFQLDKDYLPIRIAVARSKFDNGDLEGARSLLAEYAAQHTDQPAAYALLGEIALKQKRYAEAVDQTQRALALDPNATRLYATLADAQAGAGNAKASAEARAKAADVAVSLSDPLGQGMLAQSGAEAPAAAAEDPLTNHVRDAASLLALRQYDAARRELDSALKLHPNDSTLLAFYARVEAASGNLGAAKSRATAAVAADSGNALARLSEGVALEMSADDSGAQRAYEEAIRADPKLAEPRVFLGSLLMRTGHKDEAIAQYRALVQFDIGNAEAWTLLAAADVIAGKCVAAIRDVSDVLAKDANNNFLLQLFVRLASTCPAASADQKRGALEVGGKLYRDNPAAPVSEAYALALAAAGKWDEAVKIQQAAMFILVRNGMKEALPGYREFLQQFQAHKLPDLPWPASAAVFHPSRLAPDLKPAPAAAAPKK